LRDVTTPVQRPPTNYRKSRRQFERRLLYAVLLVLVVVGSGLITLIFGPGVGVTSLVCLLFGAGVIGSVWLLLTLMERWTNT
jgi:hypothetical protein